MTVLKVEKRHWRKCVVRISSAFEETGLTCEVSLGNKTVTIGGCGHCVAKAKEIPADLGF